MVSIVVPSKNRGYVLRVTLPTMFEQPMVKEVVLVDDASTDDTAVVFGEIARRYPSVKAVLLRNDTSGGAAFSRNRGVEAASGEFVLFCDDDVQLSPDYTSACLLRLQDAKVGAVSGRIVYMIEGETTDAARIRDARRQRDRKPFNYLLCELVNSARLEQDATVPFTHGIVMTRRELLLRHPFDPYYRKGNGYREESDYQMNLTVNGFRVVMTPQTCCYHLPMTLVRKGGQRQPKSASLASMIEHNGYFYGKYYARYRRQFGIATPEYLARASFVLFAVFRIYIEQHLIRCARKLQSFGRVGACALAVDIAPFSEGLAPVLLPLGF